MSEALITLLREQRWYADPDTLAFKPSIPTMLALHEQHMLRWLAANAYTGRGDIADLGCFLGGSTISLADGLAANPNVEQRRAIHSYDMLVAPNDPFSDYANKLIGLEKRPGESFRDLFDANIAPYRDLIEVHQGDVRDQATTGRSFEILFVDIVKGESVSDHIVTNFFARTIGAGTIVAHQDYVHPWQPWVHITAHLLRPVSAFITDVASSTRLVVLTAAPTPDMLARCLSTNTTYEEKIAILERERDINESRYAAALVQMSSAWLAFLERGAEASEARLAHPLMQEQYIPEQVAGMRRSMFEYFGGTRAGYEDYKRRYFTPG